MKLDGKISISVIITISKIAALAIVIMSPIFLEGTMVLSGWMLAGGMLGVKQGVDAYKKVKGGE